jgi:hypothetical protein
MFCVKISIFQVVYVRIGILQMFCVRTDIFVRWCMMGLVKASSIEHIEHEVAFLALMGFSFLYDFFDLCPQKS